MTIFSAPGGLRAALLVAFPGFYVVAAILFFLPALCILHYRRSRMVTSMEESHVIQEDESRDQETETLVKQYGEL